MFLVNTHMQPQKEGQQVGSKKEEFSGSVNEEINRVNSFAWLAGGRWENGSFGFWTTAGNGERGGGLWSATKRLSKEEFITWTRTGQRQRFSLKYKKGRQKGEILSPGHFYIDTCAEAWIEQNLLRLIHLWLMTSYLSKTGKIWKSTLQGYCRH